MVKSELHKKKLPVPKIKLQKFVSKPAMNKGDSQYNTELHNCDTSEQLKLNVAAD